MIPESSSNDTKTTLYMCPLPAEYNAKRVLEKQPLSSANI